MQARRRYWDSRPEPAEKESESIAVRGVLETTKHSLTRSYQFGSIGIPVRNLQNYGFHYGFLQPSDCGLRYFVCCRTKKEKSPLVGPLIPSRPSSAVAFRRENRS
jgi:hypothetical protein